jgi:hypothetical protein
MWGGGPGRKETHANWPPWPISLAKRSPPVFALARVVERAPQVLVNAHWAASMVTDLADARGWRRSWACAPVVVRAGAAIEMKSGGRWWQQWRGGPNLALLSKITGAPPTAPRRPHPHPSSPATAGAEGRPPPASPRAQIVSSPGDGASSVKNGWASALAAHRRVSGLGSSRRARRSAPWSERRAPGGRDPPALDGQPARSREMRRDRPGGGWGSPLPPPLPARSATPRGPPASAAQCGRAPP